MKAIVVIPAYQAMNEMEKISLRQAVRVFREETLCLMVPMSLDVSEYLSYGDFLIERFDDRYFSGIGTYSELLLDARFYERFSAYDYLLIYQLDAFAFRDDLSYFCSLGYDYFGAPWPLVGWCHRVAGTAVGNGGFSLRHIGHTMAFLKAQRENIVRDWLPRLYPVGEDMVFAYLARQADSGYRVAPIDVAMQFSLECDIRHAFRHLNEKTLPFGVHYWYKYDAQTWFPYIEAQGYQINRLDPHIRWITTKEIRRKEIKKWLRTRLIKRGNPKRMREIAGTILPMNRSIYLRGCGEVGERMYAFFHQAQLPIAGMLDQGMSLPDTQAFILVASTKYEDEIVKELLQTGRKQGKDFLTAREFEDQTLRKYYKR